MKNTKSDYVFKFCTIIKSFTQNSFIVLNYSRRRQDSCHCTRLYQEKVGFMSLYQTITGEGRIHVTVLDYTRRRQDSCHCTRQFQEKVGFMSLYLTVPGEGRKVGFMSLYQTILGEGRIHVTVLDCTRRRQDSFHCTRPYQEKVGFMSLYQTILGEGIRFTSQFKNIPGEE